MVDARQYAEAATLTAVFLIVVVALVVLQQASGVPSETLVPPSYIALGLVPVVLYLVATDQLQQFSGAGFEVVLRRQANRALTGLGDAEIEPVEQEVTMKERLDELYSMDEEERPTVLAFDIGREGFYEPWAIEEYLNVLSETLRYVLFVDGANTFRGHVHVGDFERVLEGSDDLVAEIESGEILTRPAVNTASIPQDSSKRAALQEMDRLRVNELAVLDPNGRFVGVVTQEEIVRNLLSEAIQEV